MCRGGAPPRAARAARGAAWLRALASARAVASRSVESGGSGFVGLGVSAMLSREPGGVRPPRSGDEAGCCAGQSRRPSKGRRSALAAAPLCMCHHQHHAILHTRRRGRSRLGQALKGVNTGQTRYGRSERVLLFFSFSGSAGTTQADR